MAKVGVIIGRFQCHELHQGYHDLIKFVNDRSDELIVLIGLSRTKNDVNNPLNYQDRKTMINQEYPKIQVGYIEDTREDDLWSTNLDKQISKWVNPTDEVTLYGSRDSFSAHYLGKNKVEVYSPSVVISSSKIREDLRRNKRSTPDTRAGKIIVTSERYPTVFPTVDIAIVKNNRVLMGKKNEEKQLRFIGGFASSNSTGFEEDARREVHEETNLEVSLEYISSTRIEDWRYKNSNDCIITTFFKGTILFGREEPGDDVDQLSWEPLDDTLIEKVIPEHRVLVELLLKHNGGKR